MSVLDVEDLSIRYAESVVVDGVSFAVKSGESVGLVGESGSGKTQTALAILGLLPGNAVASGSIKFDGQELLGAGEQSLDQIRARKREQLQELIDGLTFAVARLPGRPIPLRSHRSDFRGVDCVLCIRTLAFDEISIAIAGNANDFIDASAPLL